MMLIALLQRSLAVLLASCTVLLLAGTPTVPEAAAQDFADVGAGLVGGANSASAVGNIDGDGDMDVVVSGADTTDAGNEKVFTTIYENVNDDTSLDESDFQKVTGTNLPGTESGSVSLGDLDGDGDQDLVITGDTDPSFSDAPTSKIYENTDTDGTLDGSDFDGNAISAGLPDLQLSTSTLDDFDGDGDLDLLLTGQTPPEVATIYENTNDNTDPSAKITGSDFQEIDNADRLRGVDESAAAAGDLDDDGDVDFVVTGEYFDSGSSSFEYEATIYENTDTDGTLNGTDFTAHSDVLPSVFIGSVSLGDLDGDDDLDVLICGSDGDSASGGESITKVYENQDTDDDLTPSDFSALGANLTGTKFCASSLADLDADGDPDPLVVGSEADGTLNATVYRNDYSSGSLSDSDLTAFSNTGLRAVEKGSSAIHDFDGDGDNDILLTGNDDEGATEFNPVVAVYDNPDGLAPLPVELASFTAKQDDERAVLTWRTVSETNNAGFAVQRKTGGSFQKIGFVDGAGTTTEAQTYRFRTDQLGAGTHTFRLKQVDSNGSASYSDPTRVHIGIEGAYRLVAPSPNPTTRTATLQLSVKEKQHVEVTIYDLLGREVRTAFTGSLAGEQQQTLTLGTGLSAGTYLVRVQGETFATTERLSIAR